jgi:hypothetical protein
MMPDSRLFAFQHAAPAIRIALIAATPGKTPAFRNPAIRANNGEHPIQGNRSRSPGKPNQSRMTGDER